jgi:hypothetical protein
MPARFLSRSRIYASLTWLASVGALWEWLDHGSAAAREPGFLVALSAAILFGVNQESARRAELHRQMVETVADMSRVYGSGVRDAKACASCPLWEAGAPEQLERHLELVR